jgi:hypothetical protein
MDLGFEWQVYWGVTYVDAHSAAARVRFLTWRRPYTGGPPADVLPTDVCDRCKEELS